MSFIVINCYLGKFSLGKIWVVLQLTLPTCNVLFKSTLPPEETAMSLGPQLCLQVLGADITSFVEREGGRAVDLDLT